jgi:hypothetical protein
MGLNEDRTLGWFGEESQRRGVRRPARSALAPAAQGVAGLRHISIGPS